MNVRYCGLYAANEAQHGTEEEEKLARHYDQCCWQTEWLYSFKDDECILLAARHTDIFHNTLQEHYGVENTERRPLGAWIQCHKKAILASVDTKR
jgi:hypothetical protein